MQDTMAILISADNDLQLWIGSDPGLALGIGSEAFFALVHVESACTHCACGHLFTPLLSLHLLLPIPPLASLPPGVPVTSTGLGPLVRHPLFDQRVVWWSHLPTT